MFLQSRASRLLAQLRAAGQLLGAPRPWPGPSPGATRTRSSACGPLASLSAHHPCARTSAGVGAWGAAAVGRRAGVRAWAPLAMAAKVDLSTSTDWKEAKSFLKGLSDKQREEHYFCRDFVRLKKIPTWKETAKGVTVKVEEPKYKKDKQLNEKISLFRGDITKLEVDAIVNAANSSLLGGGGDVIHTVGPIAHGEPSASQAAELRSCYLSSLDLLLEHRLRSAAFPCISTGVFGYPNEAAAEVVLTTLREWLEQHKDKVDRLIICVFLEKDENIYRDRLPHYFPVDSPGPAGPRSQL
ncbi:ADP-ribose glycohydrolase MACROD1 isoform X5 [Ovis aries]|uniref:ADP-ribose glycohydrolase MACROD1 isoform X5 n=1 Tax=Ovis aries TaxID=9940 RepID=UPI001C2E194F|nr:ADP-ribose glycohydrolase MACROD1 isoform X5 [Ovis aries]